MNKTLEKIAYTPTIEGAFISEKIYLNQESPKNVYTLSQEKSLLLQNINLEKLTQTRINLIFWKDKISISRINEKFYIIEEETLKESLISNPKYTIFYMENFPTLEELVSNSKSQTIISFERFPVNNSKFLIPLIKAKLRSNIKEVFVDNIIDQDFSASVINYHEIMWIYLLGHHNLDDLIEYYQKLFLINTDILWKQKEEIVSFDYCEFVPQTENLLFLGYKNGIYHPFGFTNLDFRMDFYNLIKADLSKTSSYLLEIKEKFSNINLNKIFKNLHETTKYLLNTKIN